MSFWLILFLALGVLWLQALVIQLSALHALREELRTRGEALLGIQKLCIERVVEYSSAAAPLSAATWEEVRACLNGCVLPEDPAAGALLEEAGTVLEAALPGLRAGLKVEAERLGLLAHGEALFLRERNAREAFQGVLRGYEARRSALRMEGVVAWFGYKPYSTVGRTPKVR